VGHTVGRTTAPLVRDVGFRHVDGDAVLPHVIHVFSVTPTQIAAHAKGDPFSHTNHRFRERFVT
jgi:hypothetical protein